MAVILAYGSPALGHLFPLAALLRELAARGHQVHLRTMSAGVAKARAAGINAEPVDSRIQDIVAPDWMARNALDVLTMSIEVLCAMTDGARRWQPVSPRPEALREEPIWSSDTCCSRSPVKSRNDHRSALRHGRDV
jgi:UDP:flavonoid glycosyltransferase YjiC (YdhE family)